MGIIGVEYIMCWLFKGMYEWSKFIMLDEFYGFLEKGGLIFVDCKGFVFNFIIWGWLILDCDFSVNYVMIS